MIELKNVTFQYADAERGVYDVSLRVDKGECVVLTGLSGCGKTTLTRLVNGLAPAYYQGSLSGEIRIDGRDIRSMKSWEIGQLVGSVFQEPKSQFFSSEMNGEVAFASENCGFSGEEIRRRTDEAIRRLCLIPVRDRPLDKLSSGEKQRTAIASVYALRPKVFVCDEPTANLDEEGIVELAQTLAELKSAGYTLLIAEHRLAWLMELADRFVYLKDGRIIQEYIPEAVSALPEEERKGMGLRRVTTGAASLRSDSHIKKGTLVLQAKRLSKRNQKVKILDNVSFGVQKGSVTAITGKNGAGKTTLALLLSGLVRQSGGEVLLNERKARAACRRKHVYYCSNDMSTQFFTASVSEELLNTELTESKLKSARELLKRMGLYAYKDAHPATLSGGQKQRLAVACALFSGREILILDEPTSGLDGANMELIAAELRAAANAGITVIVITHDPELIECCCDNILEIQDRFDTPPWKCEIQYHREP